MHHSFVPWGTYAKQALEKPGIWAKVEPKLAQADNIRNALTLVSRGEAKFGIVYATDAKADPKVKVASGAKNKPAEEFSTLNQRPTHAMEPSYYSAAIGKI